MGEKENKRRQSSLFFSVIGTKELIVFLLLHDSISVGDYSSTRIDFAAAAAAVYIFLFDLLELSLL